MKIIGFTGVIAAGKDYVAEQAGFTVHSMAAGLYQLSSLILGLGQKDRHGPQGPQLRAFWQTVGQWGKGWPATPPEQFWGLPRTLEEFKRRFQDWLRPGFGESDDYWLRATLEHIKAASLPGVQVITNIRFPFEAAAVGEVYHVTAPSWEIAQRQEAQGLTPEAREDISERYAAEIQNVLNCVVSRTCPTPDPVEWLHENGFDHHRGVVWNSTAPSPDPSFLSVNQMKEQV
jgi:hypothetical protein